MMPLPREENADFGPRTMCDSTDLTRLLVGCWTLLFAVGFAIGLWFQRHSVPQTLSIGAGPLLDAVSDDVPAR